MRSARYKLPNTESRLRIGYAEKRGHRWMAGRKARRSGIVGNPGQPDRLGILDQYAQYAAPFRKLADCLDCLLVQSHVQELFEQAISADDAQCGVPGARDVSAVATMRCNTAGSDSSCTIEWLAFSSRRSRS